MLTNEMVLFILRPMKLVVYIRKNRNGIRKTVYNWTTRLSNLYNTRRWRVGCRGFFYRMQKHFTKPVSQTNCALFEHRSNIFITPIIAFCLEKGIIYIVYGIRALSLGVYGMLHTVCMSRTKN